MEKNIMTSIDQRLEALGIVLPTPPQAAANYLPYAIGGNMIIISGQLPMKDGEAVFKGKVGQDLTLEEGQAAARQCALNILSQLKAACDGDWSRIKRCLRLGGFVNCGPDYYGPAKSHQRRLRLNGGSLWRSGPPRPRRCGRHCSSLRSRR